DRRLRQDRYGLRNRFRTCHSTGGTAGAAGLAAALRSGPGPVPDENGAAALFVGLDGGEGVGGGRSHVRRGTRALAPVRGESDDGGADIDGLPFLHQQGADRSLEGGGKLDQRLRGLDLDDDLVQLNAVAWRNLPLDDLRLGQAFPDIGE